MEQSIELIITPKEELTRLINSTVKDAFHSAPRADKSDSQEILTDREAQKFLKKSRSTLQRWRNDGILPYKKINGSILYRREDLLALAK